MKPAQLFLKTLENEGVEYIFGIREEERIGLVDGLLDSPMRYVSVHYQQSAAFEKALQAVLQLPDVKERVASHHAEQP